MGFLRQLRQQLATIYKGMSPAQRIAVIALTVVCLAVGVGVVIWSSQQDYRLLYSGLAPEDAGAVTAKLQSRGVPFRIGAGGSSILVPAEQVAQLRLDLAVEGLPAKSKGFELFDEISIGMTPFQQHVNFDRALQTELAKTIMQVEPIVFARVHLVRPDPTPFLREQKPATASVVLKLKPGTTLNRKTAAGITALVARSVEGLSPEQVTLLDTNGHVLTEVQSGDLAGPVSSQLDYRRELEAYLSSRAEEMLARVLGPGHAVVRVTAEVNFQHQKTKRETYDPEQRVLVKETITNRKAGNSGSAPRGVAGATANLPAGSRTGAAAGAASGNTENEENTDSEWRATRIEQEMEEGRGMIERLTVAGLVDLTRPEGSTGPALTVVAAEDIIKQAIGFKRGRDEIKVNEVKLPTEIIQEPSGTEALDGDKWSWYMALVRNASLGAIAIVGLVLGILWYRRRSPAPQPVAATTPQDAASRLAALIQQDPDAVARLLSAWMDESAPAANTAKPRAA